MRGVILARMVREVFSKEIEFEQRNKGIEAVSYVDIWPKILPGKESSKWKALRQEHSWNMQGTARSPVRLEENEWAWWEMKSKVGKVRSCRTFWAYGRVWFLVHVFEKLSKCLLIWIIWVRLNWTDLNWVSLNWTELGPIMVYRLHTVFETCEIPSLPLLPTNGKALWIVPFSSFKTC